MSVAEDSSGPKCTYWMSPVGDDPDRTGSEVVRFMLDHEPSFFCWGERTPGQLRVGDRLCVYVTQEAGVGGVVAHGTVASDKMHLKLLKTLLGTKGAAKVPKEYVPLLELWETEVRLHRYPEVFLMRDVVRCYESPTYVDVSLFETLDAAQEAGNLGNFVRSTRQLSEHDFNVLTKRCTAD